jgi:hypothetical protein
VVVVVIWLLLAVRVARAAAVRAHEILLQVVLALLIQVAAVVVVDTILAVMVVAVRAVQE